MPPRRATCPPTTWTCPCPTPCRPTRCSTKQTSWGGVRVLCVGWRCIPHHSSLWQYHFHSCCMPRIRTNTRRSPKTEHAVSDHLVLAFQERCQREREDERQFRQEWKHVCGRMYVRRDEWIPHHVCMWFIQCWICVFTATIVCAWWMDAFRWSSSGR